MALKSREVPTVHCDPFLGGGGVGSSPEHPLPWVAEPSGLHSCVGRTSDPEPRAHSPSWVSCLKHHCRCREPWMLGQYCASSLLLTVSFSLMSYLEKTELLSQSRQRVPARSPNLGRNSVSLRPSSGGQQLDIFCDLPLSKLQREAPVQPFRIYIALSQ